MRICYIADARSPIAQNWIRYFVERGDEVHVISSYPCASDAIPGATNYPFPIGLAHFAGSKPGTLQTSAASSPTQKLARTLIRQVGMQPVYRLANSLAIIDVYRVAPAVRRLIHDIQPQIVHAMRIPNEGILALLTAPEGCPLLVSIWGNDLTLIAAQSLLLSRYTRRVLRRADALHPDCQRDDHLAREWGFDRSKPSMVLPGNGGVHSDIFFPAPASAELRASLNIPASAPVVINPRGVRAYVRNDVYFKAARLVKATIKDAVFVSIDVQGNAAVERMIDENGLRDSVRQIGHVPFQQMADYFRLADVCVSPSLHDGTPNTLLEAMACGSFPVAGDIESLREWIDDGVNGLLVENGDETALANAIIAALENPTLRAQARERNQRIIAERADYQTVMRKAASFYEQISAQPKA